MDFYLNSYFMKEREETEGKVENRMKPCRKRVRVFPLLMYLIYSILHWTATPGIKTNLPGLTTATKGRSE